jgi:hypothetical protein
MIERIFIISGLHFFDMLATYIVANDTQRKYPKFPIDRMEVNAIVSWAWKKYGLERGMYIGSVLTLPLLIGLIALCMWQQHVYWMMLGMYGVVFSLHYYNVRGIITKKESWFGEMYQKAYEGKNDVQ